MRKCLIGVLILMLLTGCGTEPKFETMGNIPMEPEMLPPAGHISVMMPADAAEEVMAGDGNGRCYTWDQYELRLETLESGDIHRTIRAVTGIDPDMLTVVSCKKESMNTWQTVWSAAGEDGMLVGRLLIADDGNYHYCMSLISPEGVDSRQVYGDLLSTFSVREADTEK